MEIINITASLNKRIINDDVVFTIGNFDGIHIAHQALFSKTLDIAEKKGLKSGVITFNHNSKSIINNNSNCSMILSYENKLKKINNYLFDYLVIIDFDTNFMNIKHDDFVKNILLNLGAKEVVVGFDFHYGKNGIGTVEDIEQDSNNQIKVNKMEQIYYHDTKIGTTLIKQLLEKGLVEEVQQLLGHYYYIDGYVIHGKNIGEKINVPTANLKLLKNYPYVKKGVYAVRCYIDDVIRYGICNIGHNPSFNYSKNISYEVHILDDNFNENLYDKIITIEFIKRLRDEIKFNNITDFKIQIKNDKKEAIIILNNAL